MALVTYPLNNIEYSAEDAELFHATRTSGIYEKNSFDYDITGTDNNIVIGTGIGWIKNSEFSGKVIAQKEEISLDMGLPDPIYPRIDAIIIQFDNNRNETNIVVKKGTAASNPVAPSVVQNESVYELHLYHVRREAGSLYITPSNITDLRLNSSYCGLMADSVTNIDTTAIEKQVSDLIKSLQDEISSVKDGSAYLLRNGSTNMTGNLPMVGHKVTGLGTPTADGDAVPLGYANQNFAPAGYGLGEYAPFITDANEAILPGFYRPNSAGCANVPSEWQFLYGAIIVSRGASYIEQLALAREINAKRTLSDDTCGEWEYINPPMSVGVEYRTIKRWNGKPVYTKFVDLGALTAVQVLTVETPGITAVVRADPVVNNEICKDWDEFCGGAASNKFYFNPSRGNNSVVFYVYCGENRVGKNLKAQVWYVK